MKKNLVIAATLALSVSLGAQAALKCPGSLELEANKGEKIHALAQEGSITFKDGQKLSLLPSGESDYEGKLLRSSKELSGFLVFGALDKKGVSHPTAKQLNTKDGKTCPYTISLGQNNHVIVLGTAPKQNPQLALQEELKQKLQSRK